MIYDYTESDIKEALEELVASGQVVQEGDGYYVPDDKRDLPPTTAEQGQAIKAVISAFDFAAGDFVSMSFFTDGVEIRASRIFR